MTKTLYESYRGAMAYIEVKLPNGDISIGSSFHLGEGIFITAKHVVDKIAQGRVWSATTAKDIGLVDEFGDLYDAIEIAAKAAGVEEDYRLRVLPTPKSPIEEIMDGLLEVSVSAFWNQTPISEEMKTIEKLKKWIPENGTYALMPYEWNIH